MRLFTIPLYLLCILCSVMGCTHYGTIQDPHGPACYVPQSDDPEMAAKNAPVFVIHDPEQEHNRIGSPKVSVTKSGHTCIHMDDQNPVIYYQIAHFATQTGEYTNIIYRIHFPATPPSLIPFFIGTGHNMGLLVIVTLNAHTEPILVTTAGTCGCYATIIPTDRLDPGFLPIGWQDEPVKIYGETLSARLHVTDGSLLAVEIRPGEHRVMGLSMISPESLHDMQTISMPLAPMADLRHLPLPTDQGDLYETSLYYNSGILKGHVKGAWKPWETFLLGPVSMDALVGMDKEYGNPDNHFYTSLKPWNRTASDMNDFPRFLRFYGWRL